MPFPPPSSFWTDALKEEVKQLWFDGVSASEIGKLLSGKHKLNITKNSVIGAVRRMHLPLRKSPIRKKSSLTKPKPNNTVVLAAPKKTLPLLRSVMQEEKIAKIIQEVRPKSLGPKRSCQWPMWGNGKPDHKFCGAISVPGFVYCLKHCRVAYKKEWL